MNLGQLMDMHKAGALKVKENGSGHKTLGGMAVSDEQISSIATAIGWRDRAVKDHELITKADRFMSGIKTNLTNEQILTHAEISMTNSRILDSEKTVDRYRITLPDKFEISVVMGLSGMGARYGIFSASNGFTVPIKAFRTLKDVSQWINELV